MDIDKTIGIAAEMIVLAAVMFLAAFFCFRVLLLPEASTAALDKIYEVEGTISEGR